MLVGMVGSFVERAQSVYRRFVRHAEAHPPDKRAVGVAVGDRDVGAAALGDPFLGLQHRAAGRAAGQGQLRVRKGIALAFVRSEPTVFDRVLPKRAGVTAVIRQPRAEVEVRGDQCRVVGVVQGIVRLKFRRDAVVFHRVGKRTLPFAAVGLRVEHSL